MLFTIFQLAKKIGWSAPMSWEMQKKNQELYLQKKGGWKPGQYCLANPRIYSDSFSKASDVQVRKTILFIYIFIHKKCM